MIDFSTPRPLEDAIDSISAKTPIGSVLKSADWENVPLALRNAAQFSATVESVRVLQAIRDKTLQSVSLLRSRLADGSEGSHMSRQKFIADMQKIARDHGLDPRNSPDGPALGSIQDVTGLSRLGMIFDIQTESAQEFAKWKMEQDPDVLDAYPAQELVRLASRKVPRNWLKRWADAGGKLIDGKMAALKNDPIWQSISRFGNPWPPFDFGSGMGLVDLSRKKAEAMGLLKPGQRVEPAKLAFDENLQASVAGLDPRFRRALQTIFGDQVDITGDTVKWKARAT